MKTSAIIPFQNNFIQKNIILCKKPASAQNFTVQNSYSSSLPGAKQYLYQMNFTGGYSINLNETFERLNPEYYPSDIYEMVKNEIEAGNPQNKTLIDIHREKYAKLNEMETLEEVKAVYPEFAGVLADDDIKYDKDSFIDDAKKGKLEHFDPDRDLSLQILQMYWGSAFSIEDLKEYTNGKKISGILEKFNIPRRNSTYAYVLKLSDVLHNERITGLMSEKQSELAKLRAEKQDGVYIPAGAKSEEQKKKISESLILHYIKHPEKVQEMSERAKKYYLEHPEVIEQRRLVVTAAWNLPEARSIRKKLSKFMGRKDVSAKEFTEILEEDENLNGKLKTNQSSRLGEFWKRNSWARTQWSKCMQKAWARLKYADIQPKPQKEVNFETLIKPQQITVIGQKEIEIYPPALKNDMVQWLKENGYNLDNFTRDNFQAIALPRGANGLIKNEYAHSAITDYFYNAVDVDLRANMYQIALVKTMSDIVNKDLKAKIRQNKFSPADMNALNLCIALSSRLFGADGMAKTLTTEEISDFYVLVVQNAGQAEKQLLYDNLAYAYELLTSEDNYQNEVCKMMGEVAASLKILYKFMAIARK